ncbi:hypothetical protein, partial [Bacillus sp. EB01]|uniref:hypothetical protein n=1 Tax=Bacillus sp. EB01 TaxID=1347086 RepID=UPI001E57EB3A
MVRQLEVLTRKGVFLEVSAVEGEISFRLTKHRVEWGNPINKDSFTFSVFNIKKTPKAKFWGLSNVARQRPTLTGAYAPTTIGAEKLNFRVRDG